MLSKSSRILVVDDFDVVRSLLKNGLTDLGYQNIELAEDGNSALAVLEKSQVEEQPIELIFSDWNMPNRSGLELLQACREHAKFSRIPFIMVTAESEQAQVVQALRAGAMEYIVKPFSPDSLQKKIEKISRRLSGIG